MTTPAPVLAARELAQRRLGPQAERTDVEGVRREVLDEIAAAGLLGLAGPRDSGGSDAPPGVQRDVTEALAGGCGATWFVSTQHTLPLLTAGRTGNEVLRERHLRDLCTGRALAGVAFAHLRRPDRPVTAVRAGGGWRFDGRVGWATSWGLADLLLLAGASPDGEVVFALLPAREQPGLTASAPLPLAAMQGTRTVRLALSGLSVPDASVAEVRSQVEWVEEDRLRTANVVPAVFGLLASVIARLRETGQRSGDATAGELAARLAAEADDVRREAYALIDDVPPGERVPDRLAARAAALELAVRAATALVAASGGSGMALAAPPQRLAREALFYLVQAQTPPVRQATLTRLLERSR